MKSLKDVKELQVDIGFKEVRTASDKCGISMENHLTHLVFSQDSQPCLHNKMFKSKLYSAHLGLQK
jgi:hypothetical protein